MSDYIRRLRQDSRAGQTRTIKMVSRKQDLDRVKPKPVPELKKGGKSGR